MSDDSENKKDAAPVDMLGDSEEEEEEEKMPPEEVDARLLAAVKDNKIEDVQFYLTQGGNVSTE